MKSLPLKIVIGLLLLFSGSLLRGSYTFQWYGPNTIAANVNFDMRVDVLFNTGNPIDNGFIYHYYRYQAGIDYTLTAGSGSKDTWITVNTPYPSPGASGQTIDFRIEVSSYMGEAAVNHRLVQVTGPVTYGLTIDYGSIPGGGNNPFANIDGFYPAGAAVNISANPDPQGRPFANWSFVFGTGTIASTTSSTTTFTMGAGDAEIQANYQTIYPLTVQNGSGSGNYTSGTAVTITANTPPQGYAFASWSIASGPGSVASATSPQTTFTMGAGAATVTANYGISQAGPIITQQPAGQTVAVGQIVSFSVAAIGGTPFSYQWKKNGTTISGATSNQYMISSAQTTDAGDYTVVVSNSVGSATSNNATLSIGAAQSFVWGTVTPGSDPGIPDSTAIAGTLSGDVSVDNKGASSYSIPLKISPGRGGMEPSLSLSYSSSGGNGPLGVGFSLSTGFPQSITRGRTILARDSSVHGVNFDSADKFYLDGKRLICVGGTEGTPGSSYRTEVDSFVTISTSGSNSIIEQFVVTDKSGRAMTFGKYGTTGDGYQMGAGTAETVAYTYALKHVEDTVGNAVDFKYDEVINTDPFRLGEYVLGEILYTANPTQGVLAKGQVTFHYNITPVAGSTERRDRNVSYVANRAFAHSRRLDGINVKFDGNRVAYYPLTYEYAPNYGRTRLTSIKGYFANPSDATWRSVPATNFTWDDTTWSYTSVANNLITNSIYGEGFGFGDVNGDGKDDLIDATGSTIMVSLSNGSGFDAPVSWLSTTNLFPANARGVLKICDVNGDGKKDLIYGNPLEDYSKALYILISTGSSFVPPGGGNSPVSIFSFTDEFRDPLTGAFSFQSNELISTANRITTGDFNGDGRDDILIHRYDGKLQVLLSTGAGFAAQPLADVGAANLQATPLSELFTWHFLGWIVMQDFSVTMIPCDLNGDGRTDYAWVENTSHWDTFNGVGGSSTENAHGGKTLFAVTSLPDGGFSPKTLVAQYGWGVNSATPIPLRQTSCIIMPGDVNGDGLMDFTILSAADQVPGDGGWNWTQQRLLRQQTAISLGSNGAPQFRPTTNNPDPLVTIGGQQVRPWFDKIAIGEWVNDYYNSLAQLVNPTSQRPLFLSLGLSGPTDNVTMTDVNFDGRADYVWYVDTPGIAGWYVMYSLGDGFSPPTAVPLNWIPTAKISPGAMSMLLSSRISMDLNGDGVPDYAYCVTGYDAKPGISGLHISHGKPGDRLSNVTDGLGSATSIAYRPITDNSIYTPGAAVSYPIREVRNADYVVSDIYKDSGLTGSPGHFTYQYSGNRLDLSGRGSLGFHSFVTLDIQTNLFKYQFLTQSFPMTGLTHREETYRWLGGNSFNIISSHDNTVVFDLVKDDLSGAVYGTLWPFISSATESRWEDGVGNFTTTGGSSLSSNPENVFSQSKPSGIHGPHIVITAQSKFDKNDSLIIAPPSAFADAGYNASDITSGGINSVTGTTNINGIMPTTGSITYGNLTNLTTDYNGYVDTVVTGYWPISYNGRPSLVATVDVNTTGGGYNDSAPQKRYTYFGATPLVLSETVAGGGTLTTTTTYNRDSFGRVTSTLIDGTDLQSVGQGPVTFTASQNTTFDASWDLPTISLDAYGHKTTTAYHAFLGKPTSIIDANGAQVTTTYDALGRAIAVTDVLKGLTTTNTYALETTTPISGPPNFNGASFSTPTNGEPIVSVPLTSAYKVTTATTVQPAVTTYFDRLGRPIRTLKDGFDGQQILTDHAYNNLGQQIATSLPYIEGTPGTPLWTKTRFDPLGRVADVTAPNNTVTSNAYAGRTTTVTVTPAVGTAQTNATEVDAKGRTVKVWNANPLTGGLSSTVSLEFKIDGFGRMRQTWLEGSDGTIPGKTITATYDALGRQTQLVDPDKGTWNYVNSALGHVLTQKDTGDVHITSSVFDQLGRPLSRTINGGTGENANFYYYDTSDIVNAFPAAHLVPQGAQGWIGAPEREECIATGSYPTTNLHYYDSFGRPNIELAQTDGKWFYTYTDYDNYSRVRQVRHYWKPSGHEPPADKPYLWQDFGYLYTYDSNSYLRSLTDSLGRSWWDSPKYDYMDRVIEVKKGGALVTKRTYDPTDGTLTAINTGDGSVQNLGFSFDGLGNLTQRTDANASGGTENLVYDNLNRLTSSKQGTISYTSDNSGNILSKPDVAGVASASYNYNPVVPGDVTGKPHAVRSAFGYSLSYDGNGNVLTRSKAGDVSTIKWTGFDKPRWMSRVTAAGTVGSEFHYNATRSRVMQLEFNAMDANGPTQYNRKRIYALGSTLELNYTTATPALNPTWDLKKVRIYVPGPDGIIGAREFDVTSGTAGTEKAFVYHYDHLGSITAITDFGSTTLSNDSGGKPGKFSEDAWGQRRDPASWTGVPAATDDGGSDSLTPRGFTGHEMLDDLGLVHMNGRIYDPLLGRFLSADVVVQFPSDLQSYNRYSYVRNNPLTTFDPTGWEEKLKSVMYDGSTLLIKRGLVAEIKHALGGGKDVPGLEGYNIYLVSPDAAKKIITREVSQEAMVALFAGAVASSEAATTNKKPAEQPLEKNKEKEKSSDGNVDPNQKTTGDDGKGGLKPYQTGTYGELTKQEKTGDGLDKDHQPSHASNVARAEEELGRPLTPAEAQQVKNDGPSIAVPAEKHRSDSPTFGGRNTPEQIQQDKVNPVDAAQRDGQAMVDAADEAQKEAARKAAEENLEKVKKLHGG